jgi:long-chain acyl-CoA synthetase
MFSGNMPLLAGATVVLMERFDAAGALALVEAERVTHTHMVPTMFHRLLSLPEDVRAAAAVSSLRYVVHGAAPCRVAVKQQIIEWFGPVVYEYYAATGGLGRSSIRRPGSRSRARSGSPSPRIRRSSVTRTATRSRLARSATCG